MILELRNDRQGTLRSCHRWSPRTFADPGTRIFVYQLQPGRVDAKALLLKTVWTPISRMLIIDATSRSKMRSPPRTTVSSSPWSRQGSIQALLVQSGIEAEERDAADKLQHLSMPSYTTD